MGRGWSAHTLCRGSLWSQELPSDLSGRKEGGLLAQGKDTSVPAPSQELRGRTGSPELLCWAAARRPPHPPQIPRVARRVQGLVYSPPVLVPVPLALPSCGRVPGAKLPSGKWVARWGRCSVGRLPVSWPSLSPNPGRPASSPSTPSADRYVACPRRPAGHCCRDPSQEPRPQADKAPLAAGSSPQP